MQDIIDVVVFDKRFVAIFVRNIQLLVPAAHRVVVLHQVACNDIGSTEIVDQRLSESCTDLASAARDEYLLVLLQSK